MAEAATASLDRARTPGGTHPSSLLVSLQNRLSKPAGNSLPGVLEGFELGFDRLEGGLLVLRERGCPSVPEGVANDSEGGAVWLKNQGLDLVEDLIGCYLGNSVGLPFLGSHQERSIPF